MPQYKVVECIGGEAWAKCWLGVGGAKGMCHGCDFTTGWSLKHFPPIYDSNCSASPLPLADGQPCHIQRCNTDYVAATSTVPEESLLHVDYCTVLRAYALCTRKMARWCRGDLVYHSAVFRIKELFGQRNCSRDGPTSSARVPGIADPLLSEICNYHARSGFHTKFAHCGLFGDPHLRTFKDEFQTCKVEGAWPLIDNRYLSVQVTNVPVVLGSGATATSKVNQPPPAPSELVNSSLLD